MTNLIENNARNLRIDLLKELRNCFSEADEDYVTNTIISFVEDL